MSWYAGVVCRSGKADRRAPHFISAIRMWRCPGSARARIGGLLLLIAGSAAAQTFPLTRANTHLSFEIRQLGILFVDAEFPDVRGHFFRDPTGRAGELYLLVQTGSLDAHADLWTRRLRSAQWLDTARYPQMIYHSIRVRFAAADRAVVEGELTLHGVTRPLSLVMTQIDCPSRTERAQGSCRFLAHAQIRRSDFGLAHSIWQGGNIVDVSLRGG